MKNTSLFQNIMAGGLAGLLVSLLVVNQPERKQLPVPQSESSTQVAAVNEFEEQVIQTVQDAQGAVVSIVITADVPVVERFFDSVPSPFGFSPFSFQIPRLRQNGTEKREIGGGSGFLISNDGMIVTNKHVVDQEGAEYTVFLEDGTKHEAHVVARDPVSDIAILDIDGNDFPYLSFADSTNLQVGQTAIAIGNALGEFDNSVSVGVLSGLSRSIQAGNGFGQTEQLEEVIQTDAAINPGNSGGPLLNLTGQVIGVNVAVALGSENIGFALPANGVSAIVDSVRDTGRIARPYLGVRYTEITPALQEANNLSVDYGVLVVRGTNSGELAVLPGSPANKAGIQESDIILEVDGQRLDEDTSLASVIRQKRIGDTVELQVLRGDSEEKVTVTLEEFPE